MKKIDVTGKDKKELESILEKTQKEILDLKMENSLGKLSNPRVIGLKRKEIARLSTRIRQLEVKA